MLKSLPERANLDHLRGQAKELLSSYRSNDPVAIERVVIALPNKESRKIALHDAQRVIATEYGFESWPKLVHHVDEMNAKRGITDEVAARFVSSAFSGRVDGVRRLIQLYPELPRYNAESALVWGNLDYVRANVDPVAKLGERDWTPLEYGCYSRVHQAVPERYAALEETVSFLLDHGADPDSSHAEEEAGAPALSALYGAAGESFHKGIVRLLLEKGANPNDGESIYHAAQHYQPEILELLVKHGAKFSDTVQPWGNTPMYFLSGHRPSDGPYDKAVAGIEWFLEHGADPNVTSYESREMPLHAASSLGGTRLVDSLLAHGANPNAKRADGRTPYELALITGNAYAVAALEKSGADTHVEPMIALLAACARNDVAVIDKLLKSDPTLLAGAQELGAFSLVRLAELGNEEGVKGMLHAGFSPDSVGATQVTPLHFAAYTGRASIARLLLAHGASTEVVEQSYSAKPLGWALHGWTFNPNREGDYPGVVKALLEAGAKTEPVKDYFEWDAANEDVKKQVEEIVAALDATGGG